MKIKGLTLGVLLGLFALNVSAQSDYKNSIGIRLGQSYYDVVAASFKTFISQPAALEFNLGIRPYSHWTSVAASGAYQHHFPIGNIDGFKWFVGGGAVLANTFADDDSWEDRRGFSFGIFPTGGVDYKLKNAPFAFSADVRPTAHIVKPSDYWSGFYFNGGVTARYTF